MNQIVLIEDGKGLTQLTLAFLAIERDSKSNSSLLIESNVIGYITEFFGKTLILGMKEMFDLSACLTVESIVIGMSHRGRLNVLGTSDVKYHLGTSYDRPIRGGKRIHLSLVANSSNLEALDPVVVGKTQAKHALPNYTTGGTIHIVVNNQVAFTIDLKSGRSSQYCTNVAKALNAPIFHVNGDDVEMVVHACELAAEWRQTYPKMYKVIRNHLSALEIYQKLLETGQATKEDIDRI
ncbi:2-oxoglutarate dehydrogenase, mitochondrial-like protein [Tanacetum coccineum]